MMNMTKIDEYLDQKLITNENTRYTQLCILNKYFETIKKDSETYFDDKKQDVIADVRKYYMIIQKTQTVLGQRTTMNTIKNFVTHYRRDLKDNEVWDIFKNKFRGVGAVTEETDLTPEIIKNILENADPLGRAFFLMSVSSGARVDELLHIEPSDIHLEETPVRLHLRAEVVKGKKKPRDTFLTPEAVEAYKKWMALRDDWLKASSEMAVHCHGEGHEKDLTDPRVFPMTYSGVRGMWNTCVRKAGFYQMKSAKRKINGEMQDITIKAVIRDKSTGRQKIRIHGLRKFFRSYLGNTDLAETLMGHSGYLTEQYRRLPLEKKQKDYLDSMTNVMIFNRLDADYQNEIRKLQSELEETKKIMKLMASNLHVKEIQQKISQLDFSLPV